MYKWRGPKEPEWPPLEPLQWVMLVLRGFSWIVCALILITLYVLMRGVDKIIGGDSLSHTVAWLWGRMGMILAGLRLEVEGAPMEHAGAVVANHSSWLDIFVLHSAVSKYFVAKAEVRKWPGIGLFAAITNTLFVERKRTEAQKQANLLLDRLNAGQRLCFFPEGTSSDGQRVLPFRSTLFSAFMGKDIVERMYVQPITVIYIEGPEVPAPFYGWWGDMPFAGHMLQVFARSYMGTAKVVFHEPVRAADFANRKTLAAHCEAEVRKAMDASVMARGIVPPPSRDQAIV